MTLDDVQTTSDLSDGGGTVNVLTYGRPGVGKTHAIRTCDGDTLLLAAESGQVSLADVDIDYIDIEGATHLQSVSKGLATTDHGYEWIALDSVSEMAQMILEYELEQTKHGQQAYGSMADRVRKMMRHYRGLDANVYFSAKQSRETSGSVIKKMPDFPGNSLNANNSIAHDFDFVFALICTDELSPAEDRLHCRDGRYRYFLTEPQDEWIASKRDPFGALDARESVDLGAIRRKVLAATRSEGDSDE